jgi:hypothetical protein
VIGDSVLPADHDRDAASRGALIASQSQPGHRIAPVNALADALVCHGWRFSGVTGNVWANAGHRDTAVNHLAARSGRCAVLIADFILEYRLGVRRADLMATEEPLARDSK